MSMTCSRQKRFTWLLLAALLSIAGCTPAVTPTPQPTPTEVAATQLNFFNWGTYIDPAIIANFEQARGVKVRYNTYESNEDLLATLEAGPTDYDLVVPGDYMVSILISKGRLAPLDKNRIPNLANVAPEFISPAFDPGNRYCVPYQWGTLGIGYNVKAVGHDVNSWADLFDPQFAGRVSLLADARYSLGLVLLYLGYSPNTTSLTEIAAARDFLVEHSPEIAEYAPDTGQDLLAEGKVVMAYEWSGDIFQLMADNPDIRYVIPKEGSLRWTDSICVPVSAPHKELAEDFINYLLQPEVGAALSNYVHYGTPNAAAQPLLLESDRNNPAIYPPSDVSHRLFFLVDVGADTAELYNRAWEQVLAAHGGN